MPWPAHHKQIDISASPGHRSLPVHVVVICVFYHTITVTCSVVLQITTGCHGFTSMKFFVRSPWHINDTRPMIQEFDWKWSQRSSEHYANYCHFQERTYYPPLGLSPALGQLSIIITVHVTKWILNCLLVCCQQHKPNDRQSCISLTK